MAEHKWLTPLIKQVWTVSAVNLTLIGLGMSISYPSSLLPGLREPNSTIQVDLDTATWLVSSIGISSFPGYFLSSILMDYCGRRIAFIVMLLPTILGWFCIYIASTVQVLIIGRILNGMSIGGCGMLCTIAIGEYTSPGYRGVFLNLKTAFFSIGCLLVHILSNYLFWRTLALIAMIPNTMAVLVVLTWPESPAWLAFKKQFERCESAFVWLRGKNQKAIQEMDELIKAQKNRKSGSETASTLDEVVFFLKKFTRKDFLKPMFIIFLSITLMELSGRHLFPAYAADIIYELTGNKSQSFYYIIGLDIVVTASTTLSAVLAKFMTRRKQLLGTGGAAVAVLAIFCTYLFFEPDEIRINYNKSWIPISILVVYFVFALVGCTPIPLGIMGEIIPLAHRAAGSAVGGLILALTLYLTLQITPYLLASIKVRGTFAVLGAGMAACLLVLYFILPETKDRTLQEIDNYFTHGHYTVDRTSDEDKEEKYKMLERKL